MADEIVKLSDRLADEFATGEADLSRTAVLPGVPPPTEDIAAVVRSVRALKTVVDTLTGTAGSVLDKAVTTRDLLADNVMVYTPSTGLSAGETTNVVVGGGGGGGGGGDTGYEDPRPVLTVPPTPTNLTAMGAFANIILDWDLLDYRNHAFVEVLRHTADNVALATVIGTALANQYTDATAVVGVTYYYWVRAVNLEAVTGSVNAAAGTPATLAIPVGPLLDALTDQITESQLYATLESRINLIDGSGAGSVNARISALSAVKARTFYSASAPVSDGTYTLQTNDLWYDSDDGNKPYRWNGSSWVVITDSRLTTAINDISSETTNRITADTAEVSARESLYAALSGTGASGYKVYNQSVSPTGLTSTDIGAIWTWKTGAGVETFQRWNGTAWVDSLSNKRAATYRGASASPTTTGNVIGDVALRTTDNVVLIWNGSAWVTRTNVDPVAALVYQEQAARITDTTAVAQSVSNVNARLNSGGDTYTSIVNVDTKASAKSANFVQATAPANPSNGLALRTGDLWVDTTNGNLLKRWNGSAWVTADDTRIGASASSITTLQSQMDTTTGSTLYSAVQTEANTRATQTGELYAQYTVKLDVNGYVAGYGLASTPVNGVPFSDFQVRADRFSITNPNATQVAISSLTRTTTTATLNTSVAHGLVVGDTFAIRGVTNDNNWNRGWKVLTRPSTTQITFTVPSTLTTPATVTTAKLSSARIPFIVDTGVVYIDTVAIKDASIVNAKIANGAIDNLKIADGTIQNGKIADATIQSAKIASLEASKISAGSMSVGNYIQSTGYNANVTGWIIHGNGAAEFGATSIRGQLTANQIDTRNLTIKDNAGNIILSSGGANVVDGYRGTNPLPQDFTTGESFYFKGVPDGFNGPVGQGYGSLRTLRPYGASTDFSGGAITQWFEANGLVWSRKSTSATTWGAWEAVPNGTITSGNVSTYIADLAVNTLQIAGNAVTIPMLTYTAASTSYYGPVSHPGPYPWDTVQTVTFNSSGAPCLIQGSAYVTHYLSGGTPALGYRIRRGSTELCIGWLTSVPGIATLITTGAIQDTPGAGSQTYYLDFMISYGASNMYAFPACSNRSLLVLETKR